jgi:hypothetical protein
VGATARTSATAAGSKPVSMARSASP